VVSGLAGDAGATSASGTSHFDYNACITCSSMKSMYRTKLTILLTPQVRHRPGTGDVR
jgi:hypothetical protein